MIQAVVLRSLEGFEGKDGDAPEGGRVRVDGPEIETRHQASNKAPLDPNGSDWVKCLRYRMRNLASKDEDNLRDEM